MKTIYISGPISHYDLEERKAAFAEVENILKAYGYVCVNPMKNGLPETLHWSHHMRVDLGLLLGCDAIYMMQGWQKSKGCKLELDVATTIGLQVFLRRFLITASKTQCSSS